MGEVTNISSAAPTGRSWYCRIWRTRASLKGRTIPWLTNMAARPTSGQKSSTHGTRTQGRRRMCGALALCCTPCWWVATPSRTWSLQLSSAKSVGGCSRCRTRSLPAPSAWWGACYGRPPRRGWSPVTFCCTPGWILLALWPPAVTSPLGTAPTKSFQTSEKMKMRTFCNSK